MIVIGITGPTGAGKTTALNQLEALGAACWTRMRCIISFWRRTAACAMR